MQSQHLVPWCISRVVAAARIGLTVACRALPIGEHLSSFFLYRSVAFRNNDYLKNYRTHSVSLYVFPLSGSLHSTTLGL